MTDPTPATDHTVLSLLISKLLDWPALLFVLTLIVMNKGGQSIGDLFKNRKIDVELGGNKLSIGDAVRALDEETKQAVEDFRTNQKEIHLIKSRLDLLEKAEAKTEQLDTDPSGRTASPLPNDGLDLPKALHDGSALPTELEQTNASVFEHITPDTLETTKSNRREAAFRRMIAALAENRFRWRSIERLAIVAGVTESDANEILAEHHGEVVLSKGKSGRTIARLPDR